MGNFLRILTGIIFWLPLTALNAWAVEKLWNWYIPQIFGLDNILFVEAVGVALVVTYLTHQWSLDKAVTDKELWESLASRIFGAIVKPLTCVGAGWVYLWVWPLGG